MSALQWNAMHWHSTLSLAALLISRHVCVYVCVSVCLVGTRVSGGFSIYYFNYLFEIEMWNVQGVNGNSES